MKFLSLSLIFLLFGFMPSGVFAHSFGTSFETEDNGYLLDIGYSSPAPEAGESVIFDFEILQDGERYRDFSDVWVRIEGPTGTVLATGVHNAGFGGARMSYVFPTTGDYMLSIRYQDESDALAKAEFPITVIGSLSNASSNDGFSFLSLMGVFVGLIVGFIGASFVRNKRGVVAGVEK